MAKVSKKKYVPKNPVLHESIPILDWIIHALVTIFLFYSAFHTGLFNGYSPNFDAPIYTSLVIASLILICLSIAYFFCWKLDSNQSLLSIYIWLIPLTFWISTINAASFQLSRNMAIIHMMYATFFLAGIYLSKNKLSANIVQLFITLSGYAVVIFGLANMFGNSYSKDAVMLTVDGYRVTSVFQYANAYAAFLMAICLCSLYYIVYSKKWYVSLLHSLILVPVLLCFWLTLSRGALVLFPIIFLCMLPLLPLAKQLAFSIYTAIGFIATLPILKPVETRSTEIVTKLIESQQNNQPVPTLSLFNGESLAGWGIVILTSVIAAVCIGAIRYYAFPVIERKLQTFSIRKLSRIMLPALLVIAVGVMAFLILATPLKQILPESIQNRVNNINFQQNSVLERGTFYKDSLKIIKEYPIIGTGGGGWAVLYERYQNNPYVSRQAHNFFLQYLVEVGLIGFIILTALLVFIYWKFIKRSFTVSEDEASSHFIFYFVSLSILIHSTLDFELSYVYLGSLVFLCLGGMTSVLKVRPSWMHVKQSVSSKRFIYPAFVSTIAIIFLILSVQNVNANRAYKKAIAAASQGQPFNQVIGYVDSAIKSVPSPDYYTLKTDMLMQVVSQVSDQQQQSSFLNLARVTIDEGRKAEPNSRILLERDYSLNMMMQKHDAALSVVEEAIGNYPWELSFYERAASLYNAQWNQAKQANDQAKTEKAWNSLQDIFNQVQKGIDHIGTLPEGQIIGRSFYLSPIIRYSVGQVNMVNGEYEKAWLQLQPAGEEAYGLLESIDPQADPASFQQNQLIVQWYLALAKKQGTLDQNRYNTFIGKYPESKVQIDNIVSSLK